MDLIPDNFMKKTTSIVPVDSAQPADHKLLGKQLTEQYQKAVGGMREVLIFGAMLMQVREVVSTCGHNSTRGPQTKGDGLKGWLAEYAPNISRSTAYRFLGIAEVIQREYTMLVGSRVAKVYTLSDLVTAPAADLPDFAQKKQLELFDYVAGTSQRSWLDRYRDNCGDWDQKGGARTKKPSDVPVDMEELARQDAQAFAMRLRVMMNDAREQSRVRNHLRRLPHITSLPGQSSLQILESETYLLLCHIKDEIKVRKGEA